MNKTPQPFLPIAAKFFAATFIAAALFMQPSPAAAIGGGSSGGSSRGSSGNSGSGKSPSSQPSCLSKVTKNSCRAQKHCWWKASDNTCLKKKNRSELTPNDKLYNQGRILAKTGAYAKAITVLKTADQSDPHVLNYLGYSYRKSGDLKTAIGYYKAALTIDPNFVLAREYLGEGYVKAGRLDLAKLELEQIRKRCGKGCKEYVELALVIDKGVDASW